MCFVLSLSLARKKSSGLESAATIRTKVFVWGLNDKDQLGGLKGSKVCSLLHNEIIFHVQGLCLLFQNYKQKSMKWKECW